MHPHSFPPSPAQKARRYRSARIGGAPVVSASWVRLEALESLPIRDSSMPSRIADFKTKYSINIAIKNPNASNASAQAAALVSSICKDSTSSIFAPCETGDRK